MDVGMYGAILMGLAYVAPPGPVNVETLRRGLQGGFWSAFSTQAGALIGDACYSIVALVGVGFVTELPLVHRLLGLAGAGLLVWLGWSALHSDAASPSIDCTDPQTLILTSRKVALRPLGKSFVSGGLISLANPCTIVFWLSVGDTILPHDGSSPLPVLSGFFVGVLAWSLAFPLLISGCRSVLGQSFFRRVFVVCGVALLMCGVLAGIMAVGT